MVIGPGAAAVNLHTHGTVSHVGVALSFGLKFDPAKVAVVTNGADLARFRPAPRDEGLATRLGLTGKFVAGYVGTHGMAHGLRDKAEKSAAAWQTLADGLDARTSRLLPCDSKMKAAIDEVSRASEARMTALLEYLREATAGYVKEWKSSLEHSEGQPR